MKVLKRFSFIFFVALIAACSKSTFVIKEKHFIPFKEFSNMTSIPGATKGLTIVEVVDERKNKDSIGVARTGVRYQKTPVMTKKSLDAFLLDYFSKDLSKRGLNILKESDLLMTIRVNQLWLEEMSQKAPEVVKCKVNFTFELRDNNRSWSGNFWNDIVSPGDLGDGTAKIAPTLASCLNLVSEKLVKSKKFLDFLQI